MPRVISGLARNLQLIAPEGLDTRPTTDRIKETLFNILQNDIPGSVVVDFFAGCGQIGIESLSRGAKKAYFIDNSKEANACITRNVNHTHFADSSTIFCADAIRAAMQIHEEHVDIIFIDAPYKKGLERDLLNVLKTMNYIDSDTLIVIEEDLYTDFSYLPELGFELLREKKYKTNKHMFVALKEEA